MFGCYQIYRMAGLLGCVCQHETAKLQIVEYDVRITGVCFVLHV